MDPVDIPLWFESDSLGKGVLVEADGISTRDITPDGGARLVRFLRTFERLLGEALREGCGAGG
jgi:hypothetical protein